MSNLQLATGYIRYPERKMFTVLLLLCGIIYAAEDKGLAHYNNNNFDKAREYYESVLQKRNNDPCASYGLGVSSFQQGDISTAMNAFNQALQTDDPGLKAKACYNMGNILYQEQRIDESLAFYKKALEFDPGDVDAKHNYELLKYRMQHQEQQDHQGDQKEEQGDQEEQKNDQQQQQEQKNNQEQQQGEEQQDKHEEQKEDQKKDQQKEDQSPEQNEASKQEQEQQQQPQSEESEKEEDTQDRLNTEAILDALKDNEKILQKRQIARLSSRKLEKDW